jgi:hypothetical protein
VAGAGCARGHRRAGGRPPGRGSRTRGRRRGGDGRGAGSGGRTPGTRPRSPTGGRGRCGEVSRTGGPARGSGRAGAVRPRHHWRHGARSRRDVACRVTGEARELLTAQHDGLVLSLVPPPATEIAAIARPRGIPHVTPSSPPRRRSRICRQRRSSLAFGSLVVAATP